LSRRKIRRADYASGRHVCVSRRGFDEAPNDEEGSIRDALKPFSLERQIVTIVGGFSTALALARGTDLIASVPERHTGRLRAGLHSFVLPFSTPDFTVSLLWHPRLDADPAHRWLRACVQAACPDQSTKSSPPRSTRR
jgi:DNA-binding transcriptional LysR family regulator